MLNLVKNVPMDVKRFVVARIVGREAWFWGSWDDENKAREVASEIGGVVVDAEE
jgi:hypothetical protein